jgi:hypothetical protein
MFIYKKIILIILIGGFLKPDAKVNFIRVSEVGEMKNEKNYHQMDSLFESIIYNYNYSQRHFDVIIKINCYLLPNKNVKKYFDLVCKNENIPKTKISKNNSSNVLFSKNLEFFYTRKHHGKYSVLTDCIYISQDSSHIGIVKLKNLYDY